MSDDKQLDFLGKESLKMGLGRGTLNAVIHLCD
jgi:hypothetical protein